MSPADGELSLPRWPDRLVALSTAAAWLSMALIVTGLVLGLVPVRNPGVQDCGTPLAFVVTGRIDVYADPNEPPNGLTSAQAAAANRNRCQERVAGRMVPAGILALGGIVAGLGGFAMLMVGRGARRRAVVQALGPFLVAGRGGTSAGSAAAGDSHADHRPPPPPDAALAPESRH